jgi:mannan endo-1,4-beta-mannosidase
LCYQNNIPKIELRMKKLPRKKPLHLLRHACILAVLLTVAGCGSDDDTGNGGDNNDDPKATFYVDGTTLKDPCGDAVILRGVNKMSVFDEADPNGDTYLPEIAKSNSNCVRIVWQATYSNGQAARIAQLETLIQKCMALKMIPMVEMHDATCNLGGLSAVVDYWTQAEMVTLVQKYEHALLVNIANEAGDYAVTTAPFVAAYKTAITRLRDAGIRTPLFIDAPDCGKNLEVLIPAAATLQAHDPDHNLMFSVHTYWSKLAVSNVQPTFIKDQLDAAAAANVPLIIGELCAFGGWVGNDSPDYAACGDEGAVDYKTVLQEASRHNMGYLVWEWGPGNGYYNYDPPVLCPGMDMTTNGTYQSIVNIAVGDATKGWIRDVVIDHANGLRKSANKTAYIEGGFSCD